MFTGLGNEKLWLCASLDNSTTDISGNGNNGAYQGGMGTTMSDGKFAYDFDGTNDYISILGGVGTGTTDAFCLSFWANWAGTGTDYFFDMDYPENNALSVYATVGPNKIQAVARPNSSGSGNTYNNLVINSWQHVLFRRVAGSNLIQTYIGGVLKPVARTSSDLITLGNDTTIGNNIDGAALYAYEGKMDDIRWFNKSLTQAEITHLASYRGVLGNPYYKPLTLKSRVTRLLSNRPTTLLERIRSASKPTTPVSVKVKHNEEPSYKTGYAKSAGESENPQLWDGLSGAWVPNLGIGSGLKIKNLAVKNDEGDLKNGIEWSQKGMIQNDADQYVLLPNGYVDTEGTVIGSIDPIGVYSFYRSNQVWVSRNWNVEIQAVGGVSFIAACTKWGSGGYANVTLPAQSDKSYTLASSFKDGDTLKLYVDGNLAGETAYSGSQTQEGYTARIFSYSDQVSGQHNWANPYLYGPVLLYKRALSASEIKTLSEDLLAPFRRKKSAIGYQPIKELRGLIKT